MKKFLQFLIGSAFLIFGSGTIFGAMLLYADGEIPAGEEIGYWLVFVFLGGLPILFGLFLYYLVFLKKRDAFAIEFTKTTSASPEPKPTLKIQEVIQPKPVKEINSQNYFE